MRRKTIDVWGNVWKLVYLHTPIFRRAETEEKWNKIQIRDDRVIWHVEEHRDEGTRSIRRDIQHPRHRHGFGGRHRRTGRSAQPTILKFVNGIDAFAYILWRRQRGGAIWSHYARRRLFHRANDNTTRTRGRDGRRGAKRESTMTKPNGRADGLPTAGFLLVLL